MAELSKREKKERRKEKRKQKEKVKRKRERAAAAERREYQRRMDEFKTGYSDPELIREVSEVPGCARILVRRRLMWPSMNA